MKRIYTKVMPLILVLFCTSFTVSIKRPGVFLSRLYYLYGGKANTSLIFTQHTIRYHNGTPTDTAVWYETISYPLHFRIDIGTPDRGNTLIFRNDSLYRFQNHQLSSATSYKNELLYLLGGLYYQSSYTAMCSGLEQFGYNTRKNCLTTWQGQPVIVIGTKDTSMSVNQLWYNTRTDALLRIRKFTQEGLQETIFTGHSIVGNMPCESQVYFYKNGTLQQLELYSNIKANTLIDTLLFHPSGAKGVHWWVPGI
jgi:hypothetical protein